ncbi:MAG TPA: hypothetical protein VFU15_16790 [Bacteroidia bacterium]|nr:hypothetical protein [Bacteroidia bacterium]
MKNLILILAVTAGAFLSSCKKNKDAHIPPDLEFKTGGNYTSGDRSVTHGDSVLVGITITKKEDDLKTFNISYAYDGASTTTSHYNYVMTSAEYGGYDHDFWIVTRNQAGTEKWVFTVTDRDGNLAQKAISLTVQ